jgi:hypothetical protein
MASLGMEDALPHIKEDSRNHLKRYEAEGFIPGCTLKGVNHEDHDVL